MLSKIADKTKNTENNNAKPASTTGEKSWYQDKYQFVLVQRNILVIVMVISLFSAAMAVYAAKTLAPLKSVEPFIIQIDEKSGITEVVEPVIREELESKEALDNYFIWKYIRARETYDITDEVTRSEEVRVLSHPDVYRQYLREINPQTNPLSPRERLGEEGKRYISNPTIVYLKNEKNNVAQVRFILREINRGSETILHKIATVEFEYIKVLDLARRERLINPLNFLVTQYRVDEEAVRQ